MVAVVRVTMSAKGQAWLEGIRVDPRVRGIDVATDLQVAELRWAAAQGAQVVRYATGAAMRARTDSAHGVASQDWPAFRGALVEPDGQGRR